MPIGHRRIVNYSLAIAMVALAQPAGFSWADEEPEAAPQAAVVKAVDSDIAKEEKKPKFPPFADVVKEPKTTDGLLKLHESKSRLFAELSPSQFDQDFIVVIAIARGIGQGSLLGGMTWGFGDDWIWQFRRVDDKVHVVRRNVRFTADSGSPSEEAVKHAYTDSILFSLPIASMNGSNVVVDLTPVFFSDLPQISSVLPGFRFAADKSAWSQVSGFSNNVEIEVAATYASSGMADIDTVADSRGATINVHYSISKLPKTSYKPRLADDRVGYFLTVLKDFSKKGDLDRYVRYINRWDLEKADPSADLSPPKKPIIFYLEKTVPYAYRKPIREGIEEWNKAFEKAGFLNAIEVRQQSDSDTWEPEDINYNTFRWITSGAGFAMGPSRVNPTTGQILDADIIFDADFIEHWKMEQETFSPESIAAMTGGPLNLNEYREQMAGIPEHLRTWASCRCDRHHALADELSLGSAVLSVHSAAQGNELSEKLIMQGLKEVTMHEVGHTLGLRHNFKASTYLTLDEMNDPKKTSETGLLASVMDYAPANIRLKDTPQGDFYSTTIGPYDMWAIEYGYKPLSGGTDGEVEELKKIASRCGEPGLTFATDEDTRGIDSDPLSNRFDLGKDPIAYAKLRAELISSLWPDLVESMVEDGEGYQKARRAFGVLLGNHGRAMFFASRFVGGVYVHRDHKGDENAKDPFEVVTAERQREALELVEQQVFSDDPFSFPPKLYNHLAATRWRHWGLPDQERLDLPVHEVILMWQDRIMQQMLSPLTLARLHDSELKVAEDAEAFTTAELLERLTQAIFSEVDSMEAGEYSNQKSAISSLRRNLQRRYLEHLATLALGENDAPQDCQTVAALQLELLAQRIDEVLEGDIELDTYTLAHLTDTSRRIGQVLNARIELARK